MEIFTRTYPITAQDIDTEYRLTASGVLLFLQDAIASYMARWRAAAFDVIADNLFWVVLEYDVRFRNPQPYWSDMVTVSVSVTELTPMRVYFDFSMSGRDGRVFSEGTSIWSLLDHETRHPYMRTHDYVLEKSGLDAALMTVRHPRSKNPVPEETVSSAEYRVQSPDIDFNGHVCNRTYLSVAEGCLEDGFRCLSAMKIRYVKETYPEDTLICVCSKSGQGRLCELSNGAGEKVCTVAFERGEPVEGKDVREAVFRY